VQMCSETWTSSQDLKPVLLNPDHIMKQTP
jgi:hypothetical protein